MPSYFILLHCSPITMHLPLYLLLLLLPPTLTPSLRSLVSHAYHTRSSLRSFLTSLPSPARGLRDLYFIHTTTINTLQFAISPRYIS